VNNFVKLNEAWVRVMRCPACHAPVESLDRALRCTQGTCMTVFPIVNECPVVLNEHSSVFRNEDFIAQQNLFFDLHPSGLRNFLKRQLPRIDRNLKADANLLRLAKMLADRVEPPKVLVLGGSILGDGMNIIASAPRIELLETDVSFGPRTRLICDAHDIPFVDLTFDAVILQAVLEHVADPQRCVEECYRVLKPDGLIYAETPFMQQVHGGRYDFTRFTLLGHRRLFRRFDEIDAGAVGGPGMALAWSYKYFLGSFTSSRRTRQLTTAFAAYTSFILKYFDRYLIDRPGALDAALGFFFLGCKSNTVLSDRDLVAQYKGLLQ
jgi:SAM-dependent methyltransferase